MPLLLEDRRRFLIADLPMAREQQLKARTDWKADPTNLNLIAKRISTDRYVDTILGNSRREV